MLMIAIMVKFSSPGPVIHTQTRIKKDLQPFTFYKFRTMRVENDPVKDDGITHNAKKNRITRVGTFLRKYRLDELPQLYNVLRGDISMVGPRAQLPKYIEIYPEQYRKITSVKPGLTGFASILFHEKEERMLAAAGEDGESEYINRILPYKFRYNMFYVRHHNFWLDMRILWWTARKFLGIGRRRSGKPNLPPSSC